RTSLPDAARLRRKKVESGFLSQQQIAKKNRAPFTGPGLRVCRCGDRQHLQRGTCCAPATLGGYTSGAAAKLDLNSKPEASNAEGRMTAMPNWERLI